jgi:hypothetical protein
MVPELMLSPDLSIRRLYNIEGESGIIGKENERLNHPAFGYIENFTASQARRSEGGQHIGHSEVSPTADPDRGTHGCNIRRDRKISHVSARLKESMLGPCTDGTGMVEITSPQPMSAPLLHPSALLNFSRGSNQPVVLYVYTGIIRIHFPGT